MLRAGFTRYFTKCFTTTEPKRKRTRTGVLVLLRRFEHPSAGSVQGSGASLSWMRQAIAVLAALLLVGSTLLVIGGGLGGVS